jgi:hypothetical protein
MVSSFFSSFVILSLIFNLKFLFKCLSENTLNVRQTERFHFTSKFQPISFFYSYTFVLLGSLLSFTKRICYQTTLIHQNLRNQNLLFIRVPVTLCFFYLIKFRRFASIRHFDNRSNLRSNIALKSAFSLVKCTK